MHTYIHIYAIIYAYIYIYICKDHTISMASHIILFILSYLSTLI